MTESDYIRRKDIYDHFINKARIYYDRYHADKTDTESLNTAKAYGLAADEVWLMENPEKPKDETHIIKKRLNDLRSGDVILINDSLKVVFKTNTELDFENFKCPSITLVSIKCYVEDVYKGRYFESVDDTMETRRNASFDVVCHLSNACSYSADKIIDGAIVYFDNRDEYCTVCDYDAEQEVAFVASIEAYILSEYANCYAYTPENASWTATKYFGNCVRYYIQAP